VLYSFADGGGATIGGGGCAAVGGLGEILQVVLDVLKYPHRPVLGAGGFAGAEGDRKEQAQADAGEDNPGGVFADVVLEFFAAAFGGFYVIGLLVFGFVHKKLILLESLEAPEFRIGVHTNRYRGKCQII